MRTGKRRSPLPATTAAPRWCPCGRRCRPGESERDHATHFCQRERPCRGGAAAAGGGRRHQPHE
eukprot:5457563-Prymnesium_polylepis.1